MNRRERRMQEAMAGRKDSGHTGSKKGYHAGCFGKSHAQKKGYKPLRFKKNFTVDKRRQT